MSHRNLYTCCLFVLVLMPFCQQRCWSSWHLIFLDTVHFYHTAYEANICWSRFVLICCIAKPSDAITTPSVSKRFTAPASDCRTHDGRLQPASQPQNKLEDVFLINVLHQLAAISLCGRGKPYIKSLRILLLLHWATGSRSRRIIIFFGNISKC